MEQERKYFDIHNVESLIPLIDNDGVINADVCIRPTDNNFKFEKIKFVREINGNLYIDSDELQDLGSLEFIRGDLKISNAKSLKSLNNIKVILGNVILRYSAIESLGNLKEVAGKLSLRDTPIKNLSKLKIVRQDLFLPKRLKDQLPASIVVIGKTKFWNDKNTNKISNLNSNYNWGVNNNLNFSKIHTQEINSKKRVISGEFLVQKCFTPSELNNYIIENIDEYYEFINKKLDKLYKEKHSFYDALFNELKTVSKLNKEFPIIKIDKRKQIDYGKTNKEANLIIKKNIKDYPFTKYKQVLKIFKIKYNFTGYTSKYILKYNSHKLELSENTGLEKGSFIYFIENSLLEIFSIFIYGNQDEFRISKGLPKIGEGWISETELFQKIKNHFYRENVKQHGKPKWLGRQHVDIWITKYKIGIEFQGKQHYEPIEHFGGIETFKKNQERDLRKKDLFKKNNAHLIEVTHGYNLESLIKKIENIITTANTVYN
jgi:hypothetical protein